jgi:hypothetical protein
MPRIDAPGELQGGVLNAAINSVITMKELADRLGLTPPAVSISFRCGGKLVKEFGYCLVNE